MPVSVFKVGGGNLPRLVHKHKYERTYSDGIERAIRSLGTTAREPERKQIITPNFDFNWLSKL
jgi:hypothetical protein